MQSPFEQIEILIDQMQDLTGKQRLPVLEEIIRLADVNSIEDLQYRARINYVYEAYEAGAADKMLVALSWCFSAIDKNPQAHDVGALIDSSMYALQYMASFVNFSRKQIEDLVDSIQRHVESSGIGRRSFHTSHCYLRFWMGDLETAKQEYTQAQLLPLDDVDHNWWDILTVDLQLHLGNDAKAIELAESVIESPDASSVADQWIQAIIFLPLLKQGRAGDAAKVQQRAFRYFANNDRNPDLLGKHISYMSVLGKFEKAFAIFERHLGSALKIAMERGKVEFYLSAWYMLQSYLRSIPGPDATISFQLPNKFPAFESTGKYSAQQLSQWFESATRELVARFDSRNGNDHFEFIMNQVLELQKLETHK